MEVLRIDKLSERPIDAAAEFYALHQPRALQLIEQAEDGLIIELPAADHTHAEWRRAAVRGLARHAVPKRAMILSGGDAAAKAQAEQYLSGAAGVTGQLLDIEPKD